MVVNTTKTTTRLDHLVALPGLVQEGGNTFLQKGCYQKLPGRVTSIKETDLSLMCIHTQITTLAEISPSLLQEGVARDQGACCPMEGVGWEPCMDQGEDHQVHQEEGEVRNL